MNISKELYLQKPLPAGNYPVVIRISHLGKEKIIDTSVCCNRKHWDKFHRSINHRDVAHNIKNNLVDTIYRRIAGRIQDYLDKMLAENLEILINSTIQTDNIKVNNHIESPIASSNPANEKKVFFSELIKQKILSTSSLNTRRGYECLLNYFKSAFGNGPALNDMSNEFISLFKKRLEEDYPATSSMRHLHISRLNAVINMGKENGDISRTFSPKLPSYPLFPTDRNLSEKDIKEIYRLFKIKIKRDPKIRNEDTLSLAIFILDIAFQGLAPTDLASLTVGDLSFSVVAPDFNKLDKHSNDNKNIEVVTIKTLRRKTGIPVSIATVLQPIRQIIKVLTTGKRDDDYLIPCYDRNKPYSPEQRQSRLANFFHKMTICLNSVIEANCGKQVRRQITYYYARHAYCNLVDSLDIPRHLIQYLIGHRVTVLERSYLRRITLSEQAAISSRLFQLLS